ncbi:MAG: superoxide dismutase [Fibrobacteria bacterium]
MAFELPPLPYAANALEPFYDRATLEIHHGKHHAAYVEKLNAAIEGIPSLKDKSIEKILADLDAIPQGSRRAVVNNGGGHANHSLFWTLMGPGKGGEPKGRLAEAIRKDFGGFAEFRKKFTGMAMDLFGAGWTFLTEDRDGQLRIMNLADQDSPISIGRKPILLVDLWEHAYYLKWQHRRADWIEAWWKIVDWERVAELHEAEPAWLLQHTA